MTNRLQFFFLLLISSAAFKSPLVYSQVLLDENFNYPIGDSLGAHGWTTYSGGSNNVLVVTSPGLTYTGYPLSNIGFSTTLKSSGQDVYKNLPFPVDSMGANGTSVYLSFMARVNSAQTGDFFIAFLPKDSISYFSGRVHANYRNGNLNFGITKGASSDTSTSGIWTSGNYSFGTTYLIILKYTFVSGVHNNLLSLFVLNSGIPAAEPSPTLGPISFPSADPANLGRLALRQGNASAAPVLLIDGIRVSRTWTKINSVSVSNISSIAERFSLSQNYPNPFNPDTRIEFSIPASGFVSLTLFNSLGEEVKNLVNESLNSGSYKIDFNGNGLSSGSYFYRINYTSGLQTYSETKKLSLIK